MHVVVWSISTNLRAFWKRRDQNARHVVNHVRHVHSPWNGRQPLQVRPVLIKDVSVKLGRIKPMTKQIAPIGNAQAIPTCKTSIERARGGCFL